LGLGTLAPSHVLSLGSGADRTLGVERRADAGAGRLLTIQAGGARAGETNTAGGELRLSSGVGTGNAGSFLSFYTAPVGASGTADSAPTEKMRILAGGNVGIGTTTPTARLNNIAPAVFTHREWGVGLQLYHVKIADCQQAVTGVRTEQQVGSGLTYSWDLTAQRILIHHIGAGTSTNLRAATYQIGIGGGGTINTGTGLLIATPWEWNIASPIGAIRDLYGIRIRPEGPSPGVSVAITNFYGLELTSPTNLSGVTVTGDNFGIYARDSVQRHFFVGNVGIGTTAATAFLHLRAGTAAAGTAPLKLTAGTLNTTPEVGAIEFNGTNLFFVDSGGIRRRLAIG